MNPEPGDCWYCAKLLLVFVGIVVLVTIFAGCGTLWRVEYRNPNLGDASVEVTIPTKGGYVK
jgi:hypothetical protein